MARNVPAGAGFAYQIAVRTLDEQLRQIEALDTKAGVLIAAGALVIGLLGGDRSFLVDAPQWVRSAVVGAIAVSLILALLAFTTRIYDSAPNPDAAIRMMMAEPGWLEWRFLGNLRNSIRAKGQAQDEDSTRFERTHYIDCGDGRTRRILAARHDQRRSVSSGFRTRSRC